MILGDDALIHRFEVGEFPTKFLISPEGSLLLPHSDNWAVVARRYLLSSGDHGHAHECRATLRILEHPEDLRLTAFDIRMTAPLRWRCRTSMGCRTNQPRTSKYRQLRARTSRRASS